MADYRGRGFRIHYVEQGEGRPVVFAHGALMDHTIFAAQFEDLPDEFRCLAWDARGHGGSQTPDPPWSVQDLVVDLVRFIEDLGVAPCHLIGHSLGGRAALRLALQREDLLRSLVLISASPAPVMPQAAARYREWSSWARDRDDGLAQIAEAAAEVFYATLPSGMEVAHTSRITGMPAVAVASTLDVLVSVPSVADRLGEIRVPTLIVHGEHDLTVPLEQAHRLASGIPDAQLVTVPGGHTPPLEAPDALNQALTEFLRATP